ncbi:FMN-dependent dehydrogenase-domain-containing protein [Durotheca rogersii]|uniref:FMN-dependent dehydrogenase-domain-containing protein n=1 Tax=Durotheca rogersii TaxID=419775 RepID=UPI00221F4C21|nr:FMN-dependent dehydrogenase-domain-containing protein [Durotheca rogersii]KAI5868107.1 FMN-dependent dehydrogenase-domain-containing protein [Durotheca rogersii]
MALEHPITADELRKHSSPENCWLVVNGVVWDLGDFAPEHPGGAAVIHKYAGQDASAVYNSIHAPSLIQNELEASKRIGKIDESSMGPGPDVSETKTPASPSTAKNGGGRRRPLLTLLSSHDFEKAASENLSDKAWAFFSSAATDCITKEANAAFFGRMWLRPRVLRNVRDISTKTKMLGNDVSLPLFVSPTAMVRLAHPDGETVIAKGCSKSGIPHTISTNASYPMADITSCADTTFFFQLYVNKDRAASEKLLKQAEQCGMRAVFVTVDQPTPAKREADERVKADAVALTPTPNGAVATNDSRGGGLGRTMAGYIDSTTNWEDIKWLRSVTRLPIVLKGVQTAQDAIRAVEHGVDGLLIGNHGGRSLDTSTPAILVLLELQLNCPEIFKHIEVYIDGGIRRGTDIFKAVCLGAKAVGMGRPFLYAANYGPEGVEHLIEIMRDEFETTMRMMGCTDLSQLHPGLLNTWELSRMVPRLTDAPQHLRGPQSKL